MSHEGGKCPPQVLMPHCSRPKRKVTQNEKIQSLVHHLSALRTVKEKKMNGQTRKAQRPKKISHMAERLDQNISHGNFI